MDKLPHTTIKIADILKWLNRWMNAVQSMKQKASALSLRFWWWHTQGFYRLKIPVKRLNFETLACITVSDILPDSIRATVLIKKLEFELKLSWNYWSKYFKHETITVCLSRHQSSIILITEDNVMKSIKIMNLEYFSRRITG